MKGIRAFLFHLRFAHRLYRRSELSWVEAWAYPLAGPKFTTGSPIEDADVEMSYWGEG